LQTKRAISLVTCFILLLSSGLHAKSVSAAHSKSKSHSLKSKKVKKGAWKRKGQQQIANDRTREIQAALINANFLDGKPSGVMDARTKDALSRYQKANGWQSKVVPDSRALIKLGLGPDNSNLLNPTTAAVSSAKPIEGANSGSQQ